MRCPELRERLTDIALDHLHAPEREDAERHLHSCASCRSELAELSEGLSLVALSLPRARPPRGLAERVVERVAAVAGGRGATGSGATGRGATGRGVRVALVAALAAALTAGGAAGWLIADRASPETVGRRAQSGLISLQRLEQQLVALDAAPLRARLSPVAGFAGSGRAVIFSSREVDDWIFVSMVAPVAAEDAATYTVKLTDEAGDVISGGQFTRTETGTLIFYEETARNLARGTMLTILDASDFPVMLGRVERSPS